MADKNINQKNLENILRSASGKLGTDPDKLKDRLNRGDLGDLTKDLNPEAADKLQKILSDKEQTKKMLSSPQAQMLMKLLFEGKK
ncbi:MAG TPA: hypothetical protein DEQ02_06005 [Ruminococcaceae bacterium]|nr:hypothetical protein [Oscillospiraceae bacterium]